MTSTTIVQLNPIVIRQASEAIDDVRDWGSLDFGAVCAQVLALDDSPEKARCLARLAGFALWYADSIRSEEVIPSCT